MKKNSLTKQKEVTENQPTKPAFNHGPSSHAGSDFGQGSAELGKEGNKQGSESGESNSGSDYNNEKKWNNEALRRRDTLNYRQ